MFSYLTTYTQAFAVVGHGLERVTTDDDASYPRAACEALGSNVQHQTNKYLNNRLEQDHRGIKHRYYPMHRFGSFVSASRFCYVFDDLHNYLQPCRILGETMSLREQRRLFQERLAAAARQVRMTA